MIKKAVFAVFLIFFIAVSFLPAFSAPENPNEIVFWYHLPSPYDKKFEEMVEKVSEHNSHLKFKFVRYNSFGDLRRALEKTEKYPDMALIDASWQDDLISKDAIVPAEDLMEKVGSSIKVVFKMDTFPIVCQSCMKDGKIWTMPAFALNHALLYNQDIFKANKIQRPPRSWSELLETGKKLAPKNSENAGFLLPLDGDNAELALLFQIFLWQSGGDIYNSEKSSFAFHNDSGLSALQFMVNLKKMTPEKGINDLKKVAMTIGTIKDLYKWEEVGINVGVAPIPVQKNKVSDLSVYSVAIFKNKPEKSYHVAYWIVEFQQQLYWTLNTPFIPANKQVTLSPPYFEFLKSHPGYRNFVRVLANGKLSPGAKDYDKVLERLGEKIKEALSGKMPPKEALEKALEAINKHHEESKEESSAMKE